jgi:fumarylacetoacetase
MNSTTDPNLKSWIESANGSDTDFPIQNLPFGLFSRSDSDDRHIGIAIGEEVLDCHALVERGYLDDHCSPAARCALSANSLNDYLGLGRDEWQSVRERVSALLRSDMPDLKDKPDDRDACFLRQSEVRMHVPMAIGDYTDFYASLHHATNVGSMFRPDNPLLPNWKHLPVGYHGRASSIVVSGTPINRPMGQTIAADGEDPKFGPVRLLDYELEVTFVVGPGNPMGHRIDIENARDHLFGLMLMNDWSARDVQKWEYQPLGPFNSKNFGTTLSPWIVTLDALEPFMVPGPLRGDEDPKNLDYLNWADDFGIDLQLTVEITSAAMREAGTEPTLVSRGNYSDMYWTMSQMLAHHTKTGCPMRPGDIFASGTVSGVTEDSRGCLLERTWRGQNPITLGDGTERKFLQDGDEVVINGWCQRDGAQRIGFGSCAGVVHPVKEPATV